MVGLPEFSAQKRISILAIENITLVQRKIRFLAGALGLPKEGELDEYCEQGMVEYRENRGDLRQCVPWRGRWLPLVLVYLVAGSAGPVACDVDLQWQEPYSQDSRWP